VREEQTPVHQFGTVMESDLEDWDLGGRFPTPPEIVRYADVVILIGGFFLIRTGRGLYSLAF
jgi:hypothetical protein